MSVESIHCINPSTPPRLSHLTRPLAVDLSFMLFTFIYDVTLSPFGLPDPKLPNRTDAGTPCQKSRALSPAPTHPRRCTPTSAPDQRLAARPHMEARGRGAGGDVPGAEVSRGSVHAIATPRPPPLAVPGLSAPSRGTDGPTSASLPHNLLSGVCMVQMWSTHSVDVTGA